MGRAAHTVGDRAPEEVVEVDDAAVESDRRRVELDLEQRDQRVVEQRDRIARSVDVRVQRFAALRSRGKRRDRRLVRARADKEVEPRHSAEAYPVFAESALRGQHVARADRQTFDRDLAAFNRVVVGCRRLVERRRVEGDADHGRGEFDARVDAGKRVDCAACVADNRVFALDARIDGQRERAVKGLVGQAFRIDGQLSGSDLVEGACAGRARAGEFELGHYVDDILAVPDVVCVLERHSAQSERIAAYRAVLAHTHVEGQIALGKRSALVVEDLGDEFAVGHTARKVKAQPALLSVCQPAGRVERRQFGSAVIGLAVLGNDDVEAVEVGLDDDEGAGVAAHRVVVVRGERDRQRVAAGVLNGRGRERRVEGQCVAERRRRPQCIAGRIADIDRRAADCHRRGDIGDRICRPVVFPLDGDVLPVHSHRRDCTDLIDGDRAGGIELHVVVGLNRRLAALFRRRNLDLDFDDVAVRRDAVVARHERAVLAHREHRVVDALAYDVLYRRIDAHEHGARACVLAVIVPIGRNRLAVDKAAEHGRRSRIDRCVAVICLVRAALQGQHSRRNRVAGAARSRFRDRIVARGAVEIEDALERRAVPRGERLGRDDDGLVQPDRRVREGDVELLALIAHKGIDDDCGLARPARRAVIGLCELIDRHKLRNDEVDSLAAVDGHGHRAAGDLEVVHALGHDRDAVCACVQRLRRLFAVQRERQFRRRRRERDGQRLDVGQRDRQRHLGHARHFGGAVVGLAEFRGVDLHHVDAVDDEAIDLRDAGDESLVVGHRSVDRIVGGDAALGNHIVSIAADLDLIDVDVDVEAAVAGQALVGAVRRVGRQVAAGDRGSDFFRSDVDRRRARERSRAVIGLDDGINRGGRRQNRIDRFVRHADGSAFLGGLGVVGNGRPGDEHRQHRRRRNHIVVELVLERGRPYDVVADQHVAVEGLDLVRAVEQLSDDFFLKLVGDAAVCVINGDLQDNLRVVDGGQVEAPLPVGVGISVRGDQHVAADKADVGIIGVLLSAGDGLLHNREFADHAHAFGKFEVGVVESDDDLVISDGEHDGRRAGVHSALDRDVEVEGRAVADDGAVVVRRGEVVAHAGEVDDDVVRRIVAVVAVFEAGGTAAVRLAELSLLPDPAVDGRGDLAASYHILVDDADVERDAVARLGRVV